MLRLIERFESQNVHDNMVKEVANYAPSRTHSTAMEKSSIDDDGFHSFAKAKE